MQKILDRLPEKQRMAIVLRDFKQVPYEEMADIMRCSKQAVRLKVFRARARLRTLVMKAQRRQVLILPRAHRPQSRATSRVIRR